MKIEINHESFLAMFPETEAERHQLEAIKNEAHQSKAEVSEMREWNITSLVFKLVCRK